MQSAKRYHLKIPGVKPDNTFVKGDISAAMCQIKHPTAPDFRIEGPGFNVALLDYSTPLLKQEFQGFNQLVEVFMFMGSAQSNAQPRATDRYRRRADRGDVNALFEQRFA